MKKFSIILLITILCISFTGCGKKDNKDAIKFKDEYEILNGEDVPNSENTYKELSISKTNPIEYADYDKINEILGSTGIIYFGFPECPWCRSALPVLLEASSEVGIDKIYYMNNKEDRDTRHLDDDGKVIIDKEGTEAYYKLLERLGESVSVYGGLNDDTLKRLYFPTVVFVKEGKILKAHVATVDGHKDPYTDMTVEQKEELRKVYETEMTKIISCDEAC